MRALTLLLALFAGCSGCAGVATHDDLRATTLRLEFQLGICSGTAIGPHTILTASHCFAGGGKLQLVNNQLVKVVRVVDDKKDHSTVTVDRTFKHWAHYGPVPYQGMHVRWWGNPEGESDMYREGVVSKATTDDVLIDATICHGDSGAGIFDDAGEIVGVVTAMSDQSGCTFMVAIPKA